MGCPPADPFKEKCLHKAWQVGLCRTTGGKQQFTLRRLDIVWAGIGIACRTNGGKLQRKDALQGRAGRVFRKVANGCFETVRKSGKWGRVEAKVSAGSAGAA